MRRWDSMRTGCNEPGNLARASMCRLRSALFNERHVLAIEFFSQVTKVLFHRGQPSDLSGPIHIRHVRSWDESSPLGGPEKWIVLHAVPITNMRTLPTVGVLYQFPRSVLTGDPTPSSPSAGVTRQMGALRKYKNTACVQNGDSPLL